MIHFTFVFARNQQMYADNGFNKLQEVIKGWTCLYDIYNVIENFVIWFTRSTAQQFSIKAVNKEFTTEAQTQSDLSDSPEII